MTFKITCYVYILCMHINSEIKVHLSTKVNHIIFHAANEGGVDCCVLAKPVTLARSPPVPLM